MGTRKIHGFGLVSVGVVAGILLSMGITALAQRGAPLPLDELRQFSNVLSAIKNNYVEPVTDKKLIDGAIAGMLIAPVVFLEPNMMGGVLIYGFAAAVLGGLTSPFGAVVGGFLVGVFENLAGTYIPGVGNELKLPIALALIISVLVVKPAGLFGRHIVKRV